MIKYLVYETDLINSYDAWCDHRSRLVYSHCQPPVNAFANKKVIPTS